jgi:hypothetical protein
MGWNGKNGFSAIRAMSVAAGAVCLKKVFLPIFQANKRSRASLSALHHGNPGASVAGHGKYSSS